MIICCGAAEEAGAGLRGAERAQLARLGLRCAARPSELLARADRERIATIVWGAPPAQVPLPPKNEALDAALKTMVACVTRLHRTDRHSGDVTLGASVPMRLSSLTVGTDAASGLRLDARCRRASGRHAVIFRDEVTAHFELINYSEWGSVVNGVMFACDPAPPRDPAPGPDPEDGEPRPGALGYIVDKTRGDTSRIRGALTQLRGGGGEGEEGCSCPGRGPAPGMGAWEGSALVPHGALLQFGCQLYVFSEAEPRPFPYEQLIENPAL